ncbi:MAG: tRNA dihydrouridine(20/20a) synthase DusA [Alphaproteobacteria bacterium]|nr:tRNA dihydrouridine(20/20a) synthase DusA [Alphaproteobacteria bacterium]
MTSDTPKIPVPGRRLCVAPMMDWTDRHCRHFHRHIAPGALLFTEMVTADAVIHGDRDRLLAQAPQDVGAGVCVALQLGGSDPARLAEATRLAADYGYAEINLNVGCPSDRVQSGRFGACLMAEPTLVADCMAAMMAATDLPVTVKCRIGIDDMDPEAGLDDFIDAVAGAGVRVVYLHARKAWLSGLSPKENRDIPPLDYDRAARLAERRRDLDIILNGGLDSVDDALRERSRFAGVMLGRAAYRTPMILAELLAAMDGGSVPARVEVAHRMADYADSQVAEGVPLHAVTRHMLGLYHGQRGARLWRRHLGEEARARRDGGTLIREVAAACEAMATGLAA